MNRSISLKTFANRLFFSGFNCKHKPVFRRQSIIFAHHIKGSALAFNAPVMSDIEVEKPANDADSTTDYHAEGGVCDLGDPSKHLSAETDSAGTLCVEEAGAEQNTNAAETGAVVEQNAEEMSNNEKPVHSNPSKRSKRARRRGRLHKRQLDQSASADGEPEGSKKVKVDNGSESIQDKHEETDYYIENGLRKIYPYMYTYLCHCKERWKGTKLIDMLDSEFMAGDHEFHTSQIDNGFVRVNGKQVKAEYLLRGKNELISNLMHRHELPVTAQPIKIVADTEDYLAIDKPSSIPVHPCGRYRHNSVIFMLSRDHGFQHLRTLYRLDRLTSGLLIFGRNYEATNRVMEQIKERKVSKTYLSRVEGMFPDGVIECKEPLDKVHQKIGTWRVKPDGKPSHTTFERLSYNGSSSVVKCLPHTGRTHQIRVHLQYLGHPIINDPLYNDDVWGPEKGKSGHYGKTIDQLYTDLVALHSHKFFEVPLEAPDAQPDEESLTSQDSSHLLRLAPNPGCDYCKKKYREPHPDRLVMFLHALSYQGAEWEFSTEEPDWAKDDWKPNT